MNIDITAAKYGKVVNEDRRDVMIKKLKSQTDTYGEPYCPCHNQQTADTICPCKYLRYHNSCRCGLFVDPPVVDVECLLAEAESGDCDG